MSEPNPQQPRRWFQFNLSTILILTAMAAWMMAIRPYTVAKTELVFTPRGELPRMISTFAGNYGDPGSDEWLQAGAKIPQQTAGSYAIASRNLPSPRLIWTGLALAGFVVWKTGRAMVLRRRSRTEPAPQPSDATERLRPLS